MKPKIGISVDETSRDGEARVLIITGAGRDFCAGGDFRYTLTILPSGICLRACSAYRKLIFSVRWAPFRLSRQLDPLGPFYFSTHILSIFGTFRYSKGFSTISSSRWSQLKKLCNVR